MSKTKISEFSTTPGDNTDINGINIAEGCAPSGINNAIRQMMADLKEWQSGSMDVYVVPAGTAAAPGIQIYGDLDTGIYSPAAGQIGISINGSSIGYFDSTGWVGGATIDTTNIEVTNIKAKDGTAAMSIADSTGAVTVTTVFTLSTTGNIALGTSQTTGTFTVGGASQTGALTIDQSTKTHTLAIGTGATESGATKTVNIATNGVSGSTTAITIGSSNGTSTVLNGYMGVGGSATASRGVDITNTGLSGANQWGVRAAPTFSSSATSFAVGVGTAMQTQAATFTMTDAYNVYAGNVTKGAGSTITNQYGVYVADQTQGDNNYGIRSVVSSGTNKWNIYSSGTASNYFAGYVGINTTNPTVELEVSGTAAVTTLDATNVEVTNIKAKDGTASITLANSTGVATIASSVLTTTDINGGSIDNTPIGFTTQSSGSFTSLSATQAVSLSATTQNISIGESQTTGTLTAGGTAATGAITLDQSTKTHTLAIGTGATESGATKTINLGTAGVSGSTTTITIGSANGTSTTLNGTVTAATLNSTTVDTTNLEVTNVKAKDGTAAIVLTDSTGAVTVSTAFTANGGAVFNENGANVDFRVEGDTDANLLFVDASADFVGIGTSSPDSKLHVVSGASTTLAQLRIGYNGTSVNYYDANTHYFRDGSGPTNRMILDSSGNLGLEVTPSAWGSEHAAFQIGFSGAIQSYKTGTASEFTNYLSNAYNDNTNWRYIRDGAATRYQQTESVHQWFTSASGTAGNTISFTQAMTLDADGDLGVGTTNPTTISNYRAITVNGTNGGILDLKYGDTLGGRAVATSGGFSLETGGATPMAFYTNNLERARIDSSGRLLLGYTSAPTGSGFAADTGTENFRIAGDTAATLLLEDQAETTRPFQVLSSDGGALIFSNANRSGTGTTNTTERMRITSVGNVSIGGNVDRATTVGTNALQIFNGTAPVGTLANGISIYSSSGEAYVMDAAGNATLFSPHDAETNEWIFKSKHTPSGKVLRIDVERLLRFVNDHFGLDAVKEFVEE